MTNTLPQMAAALADHPFFSAMPTESLRRLATQAYRQDFLPGHVVFSEGGPADRFFLIRQGLIKLDVEVPGRGRVDVETLGPGSVFGWSWLFPPYDWHLGAVAVERTTTLVFDAATLRVWMASDSVLGYELLRRFAAVMFDRLHTTRLRLGQDSSTIPTAPVAGPWAGIQASALRSRTINIPMRRIS